MTMSPPATSGLHHVALYAEDLAASEHFYVDLLGMQVEWRPDADNVYLSSGKDNLALHRAPSKLDGTQRLDHIGFTLRQPGDVDQWYHFLSAEGVTMKTPPKTHRDGVRSFYCFDPGGTLVQMIYHPPLAGL